MGGGTDTRLRVEDLSAPAREASRLIPLMRSPRVPICPQQHPNVHNRYRCSPSASIGFDPVSPIDEPVAVHHDRVEIADDSQPLL